MTDNAKPNLPNIDDLIDMFQRVAEPKIFWWSMTVSEDITDSGDVSLYRWGELLQTDYKAELCNLGGVCNKDRSQWILYAVAGKGVSLEFYKKVADVCASVVKALGIPMIPKFKVTLLERLDFSRDKCLTRFTPARYKKFTDWRESAFKSLWVTEQPSARLSVSEYLDALAENGNKLLTVPGGSTVESYWILRWFEFIFGTAHEPGCPIRVHKGSQYTGREVAEIAFRRIDNDICEASVLALEFLRKEAEARMQEKVGHDKMRYEGIEKELASWRDFLKFTKKDVSTGQIRNYGNVLNGLKRLAGPILSLKNKMKDGTILRACTHLEDSRKEMQDIVSDSQSEPTSWIKVTNRLDDLIAELDGLIELLAKSPQEKDEQGNISGMRWQDAQKKAKALVDKAGFLGFEKLKRAVTCHRKTLRKAIKKSPKLTKAEADYKATSSTLKVVGLTEKVLATYEQPSEGPSLSDTKVEEILAELLKNVKKENPAMLEETRAKLQNMVPEGRRRLAETYKSTALSKNGPKKPRQYKKV
jgi:hypothetical protein